MLASGDPLLITGMKITATGFKDVIDTALWLITSAEHTTDADALKTWIEMEVAG